MDLENLRTYCLSKPGTSEDTPFDSDTLVFRVGGKIFLFTNIANEGPLSFSVKNEPEKVVELKDNYEGIIPGYHLNKKFWITVNMGTDVNTPLALQLIDKSYEMVRSSLPKKVQATLE
ncbi:MAG: MmcQ/YjbR family DNA-binding protein [Flexibacteraceae bacterium]